jgi:hypothetical protein
VCFTFCARVIARLAANAARRVDKEFHLWINHALVDRRVVIEHPRTPVVICVVLIIRWLIHVIEGVVVIHVALLLDENGLPNVGGAVPAATRSVPSQSKIAARSAPPTFSSVVSLYALAICTAHTLNSGIFEIGSSVLFVKRFADFSSAQ